MLVHLRSATIVGLEGIMIEVEVDVAGRGFPTFTIVGLPNKSIDEAKDRVRTALANASFEMPDSRLTVNLAPADLPKKGSGFDLPIAIGILAAMGSVSSSALTQSLFIGELSLEGRLRPVPGILPLVIAAKKEGISNVFVPQENGKEAAIVRDITIFPVQTLTDLILHLLNKKHLPPQTETPLTISPA